MHQIVSACFPKAMITLDRFHHQQFCLEALQEIRIGHRREVMTVTPYSVYFSGFLPTCSVFNLFSRTITSSSYACF